MPEIREKEMRQRTETASTRLPVPQKRLLEAIAAERRATVSDVLAAAAREIITERYGAAVTAAPSDTR